MASSIQHFGVRPARDELVLSVPDARIPSARIFGAVLDEEGKPVPDAQLVPMTPDTYSVAVETCDPGTGRFALGPLPPARVRLHVRVPRRGEIVVGPRELAAGETWDVGVLRLQPEGRLRLRFVGDVESTGEVELALDTLPFPERAFEGEGVERLSPPLAPGAHTLRVGGGPYEELALPFEVRSGAETVLDVPLRRGWRTLVAARVSNTVPWIELRVTLPGGVLERMLYERRDDLLVGTLHLPAGTFAVEAVSGGRSVLGTLVVEPRDRDEIALVLALD